jgi:hypothetical protein
MARMRAMLALIFAILALVLPACFQTYCQAGQKGTQCVTGAELEAEKRAQGREEPPSESTRMVRPPWNGPATGQSTTSAQQARSDAGLTWRPGLAPRSADAGAG